MNALKEFIRSNPPKGFTPSPYFSKEGDFLNFFFEDADHFSYRVDHVLTVYLDMKNQKLVGFKIKGVQRILNTFKKHNVIRTVPDGDRRVKLSILFIPGLSTPADNKQLGFYEELEEATNDFDFDPNELELAV